ASRRDGAVAPLHRVVAVVRLVVVDSFRPVSGRGNMEIHPLGSDEAALRVLRGREPDIGTLRKRRRPGTGIVDDFLQRAAGVDTDRRDTGENLAAVVHL